MPDNHLPSQLKVSNSLLLDGGFVGLPRPCTTKDLTREHHLDVTMLRSQSKTHTSAVEVGPGRL